jgi:ribose transport system ATP-binding protein
VDLSDAAAADAAWPLVRIRGLSKTFGGSRALVDVDLDIHRGEIHGLLGENGSGKSTLIKLIGGFHAPDAGSMWVRGQPLVLPMRPNEFRKLGFAFVHQDLGLIPSLTVLENLRLEQLAEARGRFYIDWKQEARQTRALLDKYGLSGISLQDKVESLRPIDKALLAIVRAVGNIEEYQRAASSSIAPDRECLLLLDEPTAFLSKSEVRELFSTMRRIAKQGTGIVFVSHKLSEVFEITDRVTVLRDGRVAGTRLTPGVTEAELIRLVLGHVLATAIAAHEQTVSAVDTSEPVLSADSLTIGGILSIMKLELRPGEVVGLTGLLGSGFEEVVYACFGCSSYDVKGSIRVRGTSAALASLTAAKAMAMGIALVPGDRQEQGAVASLDIRENLITPILAEMGTPVSLSWPKLNARAHQLVTQFDVRPPDPALPLGSLSGGNQQKVVLARWLQMRPTLLLLHEPTQGVDVGAREQIFALIGSVAAARSAVVIASSDYEQLERVCTRVLVIGDGTVQAELRGKDVNRSRIAEACMRSQPLAAQRLADIKGEQPASNP